MWHCATGHLPVVLRVMSPSLSAAQGLTMKPWGSRQHIRNIDPAFPVLQHHISGDCKQPTAPVCVRASLFSQGVYPGSSAAVIKLEAACLQSDRTGTGSASQHKWSNIELCSTAAVHTGVHTLSTSPHIWLWIPKTGGGNAGRPLRHLLRAVLWFLSTNVPRNSPSSEKAAVDASKFRKELQTLRSLRCGWREQ